MIKRFFKLILFLLLLPLICPISNFQYGYFYIRYGDDCYNYDSLFDRLIDNSL